MFTMYMQNKLWFLFHPCAFIFTQNPLPKVINHKRQALFQWYFGLPVQQFLCFADIWFPHVWIICSIWSVFYCSAWVNCFFDNLGIYELYTFKRDDNKNNNHMMKNYILKPNQIGTKWKGISKKIYFSKLQHSELPWVPQIERSYMFTIHQSHQPINLSIRKDYKSNIASFQCCKRASFIFLVASL